MQVRYKYNFVGVQGKFKISHELNFETLNFDHFTKFLISHKEFDFS